MAALVSRIKSRVHGRSGSNASTSSVGDESATADSPTTSPRHGARGTIEQSAFHVTRGGGTRASFENPEHRSSHHPSNTTPIQSREQGTRAGEHSNPKSTIRALGSSPPGHRRDISSQSGHAISEEVIPERDSSRRAETRPMSQGYRSDDPFQERSAAANGVMPEMLGRGSARHEGLSLPTDRFTTLSISNTHDNTSPRNIRIPHNERVLAEAQTTGAPMPPLKGSAGSGQQQSSGRRASAAGEVLRKPLPSASNKLETPRRTGDTGTSDKSLVTHADLAQKYLNFAKKDDLAEQHKIEALESGHLRLPDGFDLHDSEHTHVTQTQMPPVTHEVIVKQRTEIVQEAITRDIHVHHYYTYAQPVKVVEVLPPRHFFLDKKTGIKTEVVPPAGWQMPADMAPRTPDTSVVQGWSRHYLVDEEHPTGIPEAAPLKHEQGHGNLREEAIAHRS